MELTGLRLVIWTLAIGSYLGFGDWDLEFSRMVLRNHSLRDD
jgi:hypothetical protein